MQEDLGNVADINHANDRFYALTLIRSVFFNATRQVKDSCGKQSGKQLNFTFS